MIEERTRLRRSVTVSVSASGVVLRSDLRTVQLDGPDVAVFVTRIAPLLDGTRTSQEIASALPEYGASSVLGFLSKLEELGFLESTMEAPGASPLLSGEAAFFARWGDEGSAGLERLRNAKVCVAGLEPAGATLAIELAAAGVGSLCLVDAFDVLEMDCMAARCWSARDIGEPRREVLLRQLASGWPTVRVSAASDLGATSFPHELNLCVIAAHTDDLRGQRAVAEYAHRQNVPYLCVRVTGLEVVLGPLVIPGKTACWNCARLRALGTDRDPDRTGDVEQALLDASPQRREAETLAPMAGVAGHLAALEAIKFLARYTPSELVGRLFVQNLVTLELSRHTVVRLPWCDLCGGSGGPAGFSGSSSNDGQDPGDTSAHKLFQARTPQDVRAALDGWVDDRVGVIQRLIVHRAQAGQPEIPVACSAVLARAKGDRSGRERETAAGKGYTAVDAMIGAVGEALERYSAARVDSQRLRRASLEELECEGESALEPGLLSGYADDQYGQPGFPFARVASKQSIDWIRGTSLVTGEQVWVPALPTYLDFPAPCGEHFTQVTSSGLAAGSSFEDAARRATLELIERDAFMLTWLTRRSATRIELGNNVDPRLRQVIQELALLGADCRAYLLHNEFDVPVVLTLALGDGEQWPGATAALGCDLDPLAALTKSVLEQAHVGAYVRQLVFDEGEHAPAEHNDVHDLMDHALFYAPASRREAFDFLERSAERACTDHWQHPVANRLDACIPRLRAAQMDVALVDVTSPDVRSSPYRVVRAVGERFQQIDFGYHHRRLGNPRLRALTSPGVNPWPHPLA